MSELDVIKEMLDSQHAEVKTSLEKVDKLHGDLDGRITQIQKNIDENGKEFSETKESFQKTVDAVTQLEKDMDASVEKFQRLNLGGQAVMKTIGAAAAGNIEVLKGFKGGRVDLLTHDFLQQKAVTGADASAGVLINPFDAGGVVEPDQPLAIRDLLTAVSISSDSVRWWKEKLFTNNAAPQAGQLAEKAESDLTFEEMNSAVQTIAHHIRASKQVLMDAPMLQSMIDRRLRHGLKIAEEQQLLLGDGTGSNLDGLLPNATAYDSATYAKAGDTAVDQIRRSILQTMMAKHVTTGIVLSPADWCDIELLKTDDNAYLFTNPVTGVEARLWGKRVAESMSMAGGDYLLGAFSQAAVLYDRELINIAVSTEHNDNFTRNAVTILCEEQLALTLEQPAGLTKGTFS